MAFDVENDPDGNKKASSQRQSRPVAIQLTNPLKLGEVIQKEFGDHITPEYLSRILELIPTAKNLNDLRDRLPGVLFEVAGRAISKDDPIVDACLLLAITQLQASDGAIKIALELLDEWHKDNLEQLNMAITKCLGEIPQINAHRDDLNTSLAKTRDALITEIRAYRGAVKSYVNAVDTKLKQASRIMYCGGAIIALDIITRIIGFFYK